VAAKIKASSSRRIGRSPDDLAAVEEMFALKDLMKRLGVNNLDARPQGCMLDPAWGRATYLFNATIAGIENADALVIIGANPPRRGRVLNSRIRKRWRQRELPDRPDRRAAPTSLTSTSILCRAETLAEWPLVAPFR